MLARALLSQTIEAAVAAFLARAPHRAPLLAKLSGKVIALELRPLGTRFYFTPTTGTVLVLSAYDGKPDVVLRGTPGGFLRLLLAGRPEVGLFQGLVEVEGDVDTARRLQGLLRRLDLDWEHWLTEMAGEGAAAVARGIVAWHRHAWRTLQWNLAEFLQEETRALPAPMEAEDLYRRISRLRDDVERLEARWQRLKKKIPA